MPGEQLAQTLDPSVLNCPAPQLLQVEAPAELKVPAEHAKQLVNPPLGACLPGSQGLHEAYPVAPCADPARHILQPERPISGAKVPGRHAVQVVDLSEEAINPTEQFVQEAWPEELFFPTGHEVQLDARPKEMVPASHGVHWKAALLELVFCPGPHAKQPPVRGTGAYLPCSQSMHSETLATFAYCPDWQLSQVKWLGDDSVPKLQSLHEGCPELS